MTTTSNKPKLNVKFFALVREQVGVSEVIEELQAGDTLAVVKERLQLKNENFKRALTGPVVMACNQTLVGSDHKVNANDEIAFFPPVTGG